MRLLVREISSENHPVDRISTRWISHNFFRIWCESPPLSELISVSSGRIDFKIVLNQSYGCILPGKNCFGTVPSPQDVDKKFGKKSWTLFPKSPTTSLQREKSRCLRKHLVSWIWSESTISKNWKTGFFFWKKKHFCSISFTSPLINDRLMRRTG